MLIYVIPLVILIIVLIVVKKRQDAQESDKAKTKTVKAKKPGAASKSTSQRTKVVEPAGVVKKSATPLSAETRKKIEGLIQERNFFAAEAQINQALNRDNSQHELYLLLLDIHILQKDEFAISQLINHVRSLELEDILAQAEVKKREFENSSVAVQDTIDFPSAQPQTPPVQESKPSTDAFADLVAAPASNEQAFDALQQELQPSKPAAVAEPVPDIQPLEFNFEPKIPAAEPVKTEEVPPVSDNSVEFDLQMNTAETQTAPTAATESAPVLDFKLELEPSISLKTESAPATTEEIQPLDFSFSLDTPIPAAEKTAEPATETSGLDFKLDNVEAVKEAPVSTGVNFEIPTAPVTSTTDQHDPLVQSFPELMEVNEADLNLELAQQYIQLGAYAAAREVIAEREAEYTAAQRQQADQLLNQIAS